MKKIFAILTAFAMMSLATACQSQVPKAESASEGPSTTSQSSASQGEAIAATAGSFTLKNVAGVDVTVDVSEITAFEPITMEVLQKSTSGESKITVTGADFNKLLEKYSLAQDKLQSLRFEAADGYSMEIPSEVLAQRQILLVYGVDGKPLTEKEAPVWVVIPEERAMYWVKNIKYIHLNETAAPAKVAAGNIAFMETAFQKLAATDYEDEKTVSGKELLAAAGFDDATAKLAITAADGLEKSETFAILSSAQITTAGEHAPKITGDKIPEGMRVQNLLSIRADENALVSFNSCLTAAGTTTVGEKIGVSVSKLFELLSMNDAEAYTFTAADGYEKEIAKADIAKGIILLNDKGELETYFDGLPKNTCVRNLASIIAK